MTSRWQLAGLTREKSLRRADSCAGKYSRATHLAPSTASVIRSKTNRISNRIRMAATDALTKIAGRHASHQYRRPNWILYSNLCCRKSGCESAVICGDHISSGVTVLMFSMDATRCSVAELNLVWAPVLAVPFAQRADRQSGMACSIIGKMAA